jgi:hypothetical protein
MTLSRVFGIDDQFFHIRFADLLYRKGIGVLTNFQSIYFSKIGIIKEYFVYYNFLFYVVLIPFTFISPLVIGMKLYGVFAVATSFLVVYAFLRKISIKNPFSYTALFFIALLQSGWLFRFTVARPFTLAPAFLVVMLYFIYKKKYFITAIIAFLYFYWHTATFIFPFCLAFGYFIFEQFYGKKPDWKLIIWPFLGTFGAVFITYLVSPGIIPYLKDVIFPVFFDTSLTKSTGISEGSEVYGKDLIAMSAIFFLFFSTLVIAGSYEILRYVQLKKDSQKNEDMFDMKMQPLRAMLFMASITFFVSIALSARFLDYFVFFCCLYVAIAFNDLIKFLKIEGVLFRRSLRISLAVVLGFLFANTSFNFYDSLASGNSQLVTQGAAEWLNSNVTQGKIIFNVDWSSFPTLYYFSGDKFRYVTGLEPRFLYDLNHELYWEWRNIGNGIYCKSSDCTELTKQRQVASLKESIKKQWDKDQGELIAEAVLKDFKTDIILASNGNTDLLEVMNNSERFKKEFFDDKNSAYAVYRIIDKAR